MGKLIRFCRAADRKGVEVRLFFSHMGVLLTLDPMFSELAGYELSVCKVGFDAHGLKQDIPALDENDYRTQAMNAELIMDCDRYVVF